jgi:dihydroorotate dehydrogenase
MAKPKTNRTIKSIAFENEVLDALEEYCRKNKMNVSVFVNNTIKSKVINEKEFYRQLMKYHASELHKFRTLMETSSEDTE